MIKMQCPACTHVLSEKIIGGVKVDVCENGCGGIWFDNFEMEKFDERHEMQGEKLLDIKVNSSVKIDHSKRRNCPRCESQIMMRYFFTAKREIEIDECPKCAGMWLDVGELSAIRKQFETDEGRKKAANKLFEEVFGDQLTEKARERAQKVDRVRKVANVMRFLCPSYYIPGKQKWGAW